MNLFFPPDFHFKHPEYLLLFLLLLPILYLFWKNVQYKKKMDVHFGQSLFDPKRERRNFLFLLLAFSSLVFCLMEPQGYGRKETQNLPLGLNQPLPLLFLLDTSLSMTTPDASFHKSRFEEAKEILTSFLNQETVYPKALYTFTDHLQPIIPLTLDTTYMGLTLDALDPAISQEGTDILKTLRELQQVIKPRQVILISDGEDTSVHPDIEAMEQVVSSMAKEGITFHVIGVGSVEGAPIPNLTYENKPVVSKKNSGLLQGLATAGGGQYIDPAHVSVMTLTQHVSEKLSQNTYQKLYAEEPTESYAPLFGFFLIITLIALLRGF